MRKILVFCGILFVCNVLTGQNSAVLDSLFKVLPSLKEDTNKIKTLVKISVKSVFGDPEKGLQYGEEALKLSKKLNWTKGTALAYACIGDAYENKGENSRALETRLTELKLWQALKTKSKICGTLGNIGVSYSNLGDNLNALRYYISALKMAEEVNNKKVMTNMLINIATIYQDLKQVEKAKEYYLRAKRLAIENNLQNAIVIINTNLGLMCVEEKRFSGAKPYYFEALKMAEKLDRKMHQAYILSNIAQMFAFQADSAMANNDSSYSQKKYNEAIIYHEKARKVAESIGLNTLISAVEANISDIYAKQGQYHKALERLKIASRLAEETTFFNEINKDYERYYKLYKAINKPQLALEYFEKLSRINDSTRNVLNKKEVIELELKYETEKKESEIKVLTQNNKILMLSSINKKYLVYGLSIIIILFLTLGLLVFRQHKLKSKQETVRLEQKLLRAQMNPHFLFNSISSIESYIYEHQPKEAGDYLAQFARLMRLILENSASEYITLDKEVETLEYYLSLQKLRMNDNLDYIIHIDPSIQTSQVSIPPMLTQPFIENAIEHGFRGLKECGKIRISFSLIDDVLQVKITDNGMGIVQAQQQKELYNSHKSMAVQITYERLKFLNKAKNKKMHFEIKEIEQEGKKGTEVLFSIPA